MPRDALEAEILNVGVGAMRWAASRDNREAAPDFEAWSIGQTHAVVEAARDLGNQLSRRTRRLLRLQPSS